MKIYGLRMKIMKHFFQRNHKMPKTGPSPATWLQRLREYAQGTFQFERGQRPGKDSYWAKRLETIEKCPKHKNPGNQDALGRRITCACGFHTPRRPAQQVNTASRQMKYLLNSYTDRVSFCLSGSFIYRPSGSYTGVRFT